MKMTMEEAVLREIERRISVLENYITTLPFYALKKRANTRNLISRHEARLRQSRKNAEIERKRGMDPRRFDPQNELDIALLNLLASPPAPES
jgi:hypothetical protein